MIGILCPDFQYESLSDIPIDRLQTEGIQGLILDLDNTIAPWNDNTLSEEVVDWFQRIKIAGIKACIVSNNTAPDRVAAVADILGILYVYRAAKPRKKAFLLGMKELDLEHSAVAVIGDQLFTDVFGGNRIGLKTILVSPLASREFAGTKVLRFLEWLVGRKANYLQKTERKT